MISGEKPGRRWKAAIPLQIQGMDHRSKFFDEAVETYMVSEHLLMTRLESLIDLETEVHVTNLQNEISGTFRVLWANARPENQRHATGLELVQAEGQLWEFPGDLASRPELAPWAFLECRRCHLKVLLPVREAEDELLSEGFVMARVCEQCKGTTPWHFTAQADDLDLEVHSSTDKDGEIQWSLRKKRTKDLRRKGRAPLQMQIKVIRKSYGQASEEICRTLNVSRHGVCFLSPRSYEVGERVMIVLPYEEASVAIPVKAKVVRLDEAPNSLFHAVAIQLEPDHG